MPSPSTHFYTFLLNRLHSSPLPNSGSLARDLLASERTFLSWSRTGLGFIALGVAIEKVEALAFLSPTALQLEDSRRSKIAAGVLVGSGALCVAHGTQRYFGTLKLLKEGKFRPNTVGVAGFAAVCVAVAGVGSILILEGAGSQNGGVEKRDRAI